MAYTVLRGVEPKGEGVVLVDDLPRIKVVCAEAGFECVSFVLPNRDLAASVQLAMELGMNEVSKQLGLPKKHLHALVSGPLVKPDGSPVPAEEWVNNHFIVVKMQQDKEEEGLLWKTRTQHAFLEDVTRKGIQDLDVLTSEKTVDDVPNMAKELRLLKEENASLREKFIALERKDNALEAANAISNAKFIALEAEITILKAENERLKVELEKVQKKIANLSGMDLVMMQTMLEACRTKCRILLSQRNIHVPFDWNKLMRDPICIKALQEAGLTIGLPATAYGKKSQQEKGYEVAHSIMESPEVYATIVCKMHGHPREQMMNIFEFVFQRTVEDLAFEDFEEFGG